MSVSIVIRHMQPEMHLDLPRAFRLKKQGDGLSDKSPLPRLRRLTRIKNKRDVLSLPRKALVQSHRVKGGNDPRGKRRAVPAIHSGKRAKLDSLGGSTSASTPHCIKGSACTEEDGGNQTADTLRCSENSAACTFPNDVSDDIEVDGVAASPNPRHGLPLHLGPDGNWKDYGCQPDPEYNSEDLSDDVLLRH